MRILLLALMMALCGCSALADDDYYPLHVGDEWTMTITIVTPAGKTTEGIVHRKTESTIERDEKTYYRSRFWSEGLPTKIEVFTLFRKDEKRAYSMDEKNLDAIEQVEALLPLKVGATWHHTFKSDARTDTVIGMETLEIAGKTYENCWHIRSVNSNESHIENYWQAPIEGIIKSEVVSNGIKISIVIKDFKPAK
jgi:hypothetical protein